MPCHPSVISELTSLPSELIAFLLNTLREPRTRRITSDTLLQTFCTQKSSAAGPVQEAISRGLQSPVQAVQFRAGAILSSTHHPPSRTTGPPTAWAPLCSFGPREHCRIHVEWGVSICLIAPPLSHKLEPAFLVTNLILPLHRSASALVRLTFSGPSSTLEERRL
jgi:hypothetical protein